MSEEHDTQVPPPAVQPMPQQPRHDEPGLTESDLNRTRVRPAVGDVLPPVQPPAPAPGHSRISRRKVWLLVGGGVLAVWAAIFTVVVATTVIGGLGGASDSPTTVFKKALFAKSCDDAAQYISNSKRRLFILGCDPTEYGDRAKIQKDWKSMGKIRESISGGTATLKYKGEMDFAEQQVTLVKEHGRWRIWG